MEMFPSLNPFEDITETEFSPMARVKRTSFIKKIQDTYIVFSGQLIEANNATNYWNHPKNHFGFTDYFTLFTPYLFGILFDIAKKNWQQPNIGWKLVVVAAGLIYTPFFIMKHGISSILTLMSLPIVGLVHLLYAKDGEQLKNQALELPGEAQSLRSHLEQSDGDIEDILESSFSSINNSLQFMHRPQNHSFWKEKKKDLGITDVNTSKFVVKLPIVEYKGISIVSELPFQREKDILYLLT